MTGIPKVSLSVVSHGQGGLVRALLADLAAHVKTRCEVVLTVNIPEPDLPDLQRMPFPVRVISNPAPKGFGANHNAAFRASSGRFFCVLNPDIRMSHDPFPALLTAAARPDAGVVAPVIRGPDGGIENSARPFPTPLSILRKALFGAPPALLPPATGAIHPDWVAGMFMLIPRDLFAALGGFDERYFLYYEDVDLCARARLQGRDVVVTADAEAVHEARRQSHSDARYRRWHVRSMARFFLSPVFVKAVMFGGGRRAGGR